MGLALNLGKTASLGLIAALLGCSGDETKASRLESDTPPEASSGGNSGSPDTGGNAGEQTPAEVPADVVEDPGANVELTLNSPTLSELNQQLTVARNLDTDGLLQSYPHSFQPASDLDLSVLVGFEQLQASSLSLNEPEQAALVQNGFVILPRKEYPSVPYGYSEVYSEDLPIYVSADMVLDAVHRSYDDVLRELETTLMIPRLTRLLTSMRERLVAEDSNLTEEARRDADLFLTVALDLLSSQPVIPVAGADSETARTLRNGALAATGTERVQLFGINRLIDFSQFKPRGHYEGTPILERYFRAMMWLGRIDLRLLETNSAGERIFRRRQVELAVALRGLLNEQALADWQSLDQVVSLYVGEHDYMTVPQVDELLESLGRLETGDLSDLDDTQIAQAVVDGQYAEQRIASHVVVSSGSPEGGLPLSASFAFFGQRYTVDSHVFSKVVYDRTALRVLPNGLDAAFGALGNNHAAQLLEEELREARYAPDLAEIRTLVDNHPDSYWQGSLYTRWLSALRTLSVVRDNVPGLPAVAQTEAWGRRLLNTQLSSWAQLRHDTLLYAKQSYTVSTLCEFPDAYVDPYPDFFFAIANFAELGRQSVEDIGLDDTPEGTALQAKASQYFAELGRVSGVLGEMAELQRTGMPHTPDHIAFINQAIRVGGGGSGAPFHDGWYRELFFDPETALNFEPTIADVHTDAGGDVPFSRGASVLHVATGLPRSMIVAIDTCEGPRVYAGVVSAYHEFVEPGLTRLADSEWEEQLLQQSEPHEDVPWMQTIVVPATAE